MLVMQRLVWMKTGAKSEAVAAKAEEMEKKITAGFCGCLGGVLRGSRPASLDKFKLVTTGAVYSYMIVCMYV